jgi:hypothetical protein
MDSITREITGRRGSETHEPPTYALTIKQFCATHNISLAFYFELQKRGEGPRVMNVGRRRLISIEEAARWREARTETAA